MRHHPNPYAIVIAGSASLAIAMGVGRFAFTPILPMMLDDGTLDLSLAGSLATANYVGYLVGALLAMLMPRTWSDTTIIRLTLVSTAILTALMAMPVGEVWVALRFLAGVVSAVGFVFTSGWCLAELSGSSGSVGSGIYTGPGAGIAMSGIAASFMTFGGLSGSDAWVTFATMSAVLSASVWGVFRASHKPPELRLVSAPPGDSGRVPKAEMPLFALAYGLAGFGYIVTATYLPVIAKSAVQDSSLLTLFWPLFGLAAVFGSLLAARIRRDTDMRLYLTGAYLVQAVGVGISAFWHDALGLSLSSALVGLPFTAISFFAMNEVRRIRTRNHARYMGLLTAVFAIGQIAGPPVVGIILARTASIDTGFDLALGVAGITLVVGAAIFVAMIVLYPSEGRRSAREMPSPR